MPSLSHRLDFDDGVVDGFMNSLPDIDTRGLLSFHFLFGPRAMTTYFRKANYKTMQSSYDDARATIAFRQRIYPQLHGSSEAYLDRRMKAAHQQYLVLKIRREYLLFDAFDQLWQRESRELLRPLRVRMGLDEGEVGADYGGVQVEFLNLVCQEAFHSERCETSNLPYFLQY